MIVFLTSDVGATKKINGVRQVTKLDNTNFFVENLQKYVKGGKKFVFVSSNKNTYDINDSYGALTFQSFNMSGFNFEQLYVIDARTQQQAEEILKDADLVFLAGGDTIKEMEFFEELNLSKLLKKHAKVVVGQSAGALNLADEVYCSPEDKDELENKRYFKGLGLTKVNIEPHYKHSPHFDEWDDLQKILLEDSPKKPFYAIVDGAYIVDDGKKQILFGEGYRFDGGKCKQICENGKSLDISQKERKKA